MHLDIISVTLPSTGTVGGPARSYSDPPYTSTEVPLDITRQEHALQDSAMLQIVYSQYLPLKLFLVPRR